MHRRDILRFCAGVAFGGLAFGGYTVTDAEKQAAEWRAKAEEMRARALAAFPYPHIDVPGDQALTTWQKLKAEGRGCSVVVGDDKAFSRMVEPFSPDWPQDLQKRTLDELLSAAGKIKIPDDLFTRRKAEDQAGTDAGKRWAAGPDTELPTIIKSDDPQSGTTVTQYITTVPSAADQRDKMQPPLPPHSRVLTPSEVRAELVREREAPAVGEWPDKPAPSTGLSVATDIVTGKPLAKVHIVTIPTDDWTTIPAYLRYGDWNDCPPAEWHVAALRSWRDRYGIELVGFGPDTMNLRAARRPRSRDEAITLAREQWAYCTDIVEQGTETLSNLAACLMSDDWWFFWWD